MTTRQSDRIDVEGLGQLLVVGLSWRGLSDAQKANRDEALDLVGKLPPSLLESAEDEARQQQTKGKGKRAGNADPLFNLDLGTVLNRGIKGLGDKELNAKEVSDLVEELTPRQAREIALAIVGLTEIEDPENLG